MHIAPLTIISHIPVLTANCTTNWTDLLYRSFTSATNAIIFHHHTCPMLQNIPNSKIYTCSCSVKCQGTPRIVSESTYQRHKKYRKETYSPQFTQFLANAAMQRSADSNLSSSSSSSSPNHHNQLQESEGPSIWRCDAVGLQNQVSLSSIQYFSSLTNFTLMSL